MAAAIRLIALTCCLLVLTDSFPCNITVWVHSKTDKKFKAVVLVPAIKVRSLPMIFKKKDVMKKVRIEGEDCASKHWMIRTFKWKHEQWKPAKNISAKFQGWGWFRVRVGDDLVPHPADRLGIMCSEGDCH